MGLLADLLSWVDSRKRVAGRNIRDLINDPAAALENTGYQAALEMKDPSNYGPGAMKGLLGVLRNPALQNQAISHFGTTFSPAETGFILDNGSRLDLSGRHYGSGYTNINGKYRPMPGQPDYLSGSRNVDHRELGDLVPEGGWNGLSDFMNQTGAVRYMPDVGISVIDSNMPNRAQIEKAVTDFRRNRSPMNVDVDAQSGSSRASQEFDRPTVDAVLEWIKAQMKPNSFE